MKKLLVIFPLVLVFGCSSKRDKRTFPEHNPYIEEYELEHRWDNMTMEEKDRELDSMNAHGEYMLVRGAKRNYDTIIDHVHYKYITDK